ncbi:MAG: dTDP-4-dehydrorhamnose 3,5-epimerase [Nevskiales bacterium]
MIFIETPLAGAFLIELTPIEDERGAFARSFCQTEFAAHGIFFPVAQCNISRNHRRGTLRGMHMQRDPHAEKKLVRCSRGALWDVLVDLRPGSPTRGRWYGAELTEANGRMLYIPEGFAHGFQTLADDTTVDYMMSAFYASAAGAGVRWNDPALGIDWPISDPIMSERDRIYPDWQP